MRTAFRVARVRSVRRGVGGRWSEGVLTDVLLFSLDLSAACAVALTAADPDPSMPASRSARAGSVVYNGRDASVAEPAEETRPASRRSVTRGAPEPSSSQVLDALRAVARELRVSGRAAEQRLGLHPAQLHALQQLAERPAHSLAELAERTHTDPSSVSVVVQRLVERGLVVRTPAADDRRRTELAATAAGRALARRAPESTARRLERALSSMGDRDSTSLARTLSALARGLRVADGTDGRR